MTSLPKNDAAVGRRLSVADAVDFVSKAQTREYQFRCLNYWRDLYGEEYARQIEAQIKWCERW